MTDAARNPVLDDLDALVSRLDTQLSRSGAVASGRSSDGTGATGHSSDGTGATGSLPASVSRRRDAIDAILGSSPRATNLQSLREHETILRFRQELSDGLIRLDTARQLLGLIRMVVDTVMT